MDLRKIITSILLGMGIAVTGVTSAGAGMTETWAPDPDCTYSYTRHAVKNGVLIDRRGNYRVYGDHQLQRATTGRSCDATSGIRAMATFRCERYDARTERWVGTPCAARGVLYLYEGYDVPPNQKPFQFTAAQTGSDGLITVYGLWDDYECLYSYTYESMIRVDSLTIGGFTWTNMLRDGSSQLPPCE